MNNRLAQLLRAGIALLLIFILLMLIFAGFRFIRNAFNSKSQQQIEQQAVKLADFAKSDTSVNYINDGQVVAPEDHYSVVVNVTAANRTINVIRGFGQPPVLVKSFANNTSSYEVFLSALSSAGYTKSQTARSGTSRTGSCPFGNRYSYQAFDSSAKLVLDLWSNSCTSNSGTASGDTSTIRQLFELQIPNYDEIVDSVQQ